MAVRRKERWRVNVTAYIWDFIDGERKFLIARRVEYAAEFPGKWEVIGGGVTVEDHQDNAACSPDGAKEYTLIEALKRETWEEVGIRICDIEYINDFTYQRASDNVWAIGFRFVARRDPLHADEVLLKDRSHDAHRWVSHEEAGEFDLLGDIAKNIRVIDALLKRREVTKACGIFF